MRRATLQTIEGVKATLNFEGGFAGIFVQHFDFQFVEIRQDGDLIHIPASDFRAFLKALSEWADEAGIPA